MKKIPKSKYKNLYICTNHIDIDLACKEIRKRLKSGKIDEIDDLITEIETRTQEAFQQGKSMERRLEVYANCFKLCGYERVRKNGNSRRSRSTS